MADPSLEVIKDWSNLTLAEGVHAHCRGWNRMILKVPPNPNHSCFHHLAPLLVLLREVFWEQSQEFWLCLEPMNEVWLHIHHTWNEFSPPNMVKPLENWGEEGMNSSGQNKPTAGE